jgi:DNA-3-methyladenine glycosylase
MRLTEDFYSKNATELAPLLLGKLLCRAVGGSVIKLRVTETESYFGETDTACHASKGRTPRTEIMYRHGGFAYVYLCYGIHSLLNVVSGGAEHPQAVLIRGVEGFNGPGKLTKHLQITRSLNGENLTESDALWLEDDGFAAAYRAAPRVGIAYAAREDRERLWRFLLQ